MHIKQILKLDEDRILIEQLRLLLINFGSSVIPALVLATLMFFAVSNEDNRAYLAFWCGIVMLSKLNSYRMARNYLAAGMPLKQLSRIVKTLIFVNTFDGLLWGALTWVALDSAGLSGSILVISVVGGVAAAAMSLLSPIFPAFLGFVVAELTVVVFKLWGMGNPSYTALGIAGVVYLITLLLQGFNSARAARAAIELRFENTKLLDQLRVEKINAETSQHEAERSNKAKSKFLAAASHDLRQPIHAQGLFLEALSLTSLTPHQSELLNHSRAASEATGELLNALLDFSRIEAGVIEPQMQPMLLQPLLHKIENELAPQADAKNIVYRSRETQLAIRSDPMLLELILRNLISNAIRYTQQGGVFIGCRLRGTTVVIEVWDTGIGIAQENQQEVFREFHQLGNPERDRNKGLGLGLAIASGLARTLGHRLTLSSTPQRGSVFRLVVPIAIAPSIRKNSLVFSKENLIGVRALVIDDDEIVRTGMLPLLRNWGCECMTAESIETALALSKGNAPDVIISDYRLREHHTGVEAIEAVRALCGCTIPALLITGDTSPERLREAKDSGIPLLHKPVSTHQLHQKIGEVLGNFTPAQSTTAPLPQAVPE